MTGTQTLFDLGEMVVSDAAKAALAKEGLTQEEYLDRHQRGDWGANWNGIRLCNQIATESQEGTIFSQYAIAKDVMLWVVTELENSTTQVLMSWEW